MDGETAITDFAMTVYSIMRNVHLLHHLISTTNDTEYQFTIEDFDYTIVTYDYTIEACDFTIGAYDSKNTRR